MVICDIVLISLIVLILDLLTFQCAVLVYDTSCSAVSSTGLVHIYIWRYCPNQVSFLLLPSIAIHIISSNFNTVKF